MLKRLVVNNWFIGFLVITSCWVLGQIYLRYNPPEVSGVNPTTTPILLTAVASVEKDWELVSAWQAVQGSKTLYTAEAHRPGEDPRVHHQVFLEIYGCTPGSTGVLFKYPNNKTEVTITTTKAFGTNAVITPNQGIVGFDIIFVTPRCH